MQDAEKGGDGELEMIDGCKFQECWIMSSEELLHKLHIVWHDVMCTHL